MSSTLTGAVRAALPLLLLVILAGLRLGYAAGIELAEDEAYYWVWSQRLAAGYYDHPPAIAWIIRAGVTLLGDTEAGVRLGAVLLSTLSAALVADLVPERRGLTLALAMSLPLFALGGLLASPDAPLCAAWALGLWAATRENWLLVGLAAGLAMMSKYTGALLLPLLVFADPGALRRRGPYLAALVALAILLPNLVWNAQQDWVSYRFQLNHIAERRDALGLFFAQAGLWGPLSWLGMLGAWARRPTERADRLAWWSSLPVLAIATASGGEANWAAPAAIGGLVLFARAGGRLQRLLPVALGVNLVLGGCVMLHLYRPLLDLPVDPRDAVSGGRTLGESLRAWGEPVVTTARYQEAALIHFYGGVAARTLPQTGRLDQYDLWDTSLPDRGLFVRPWRAGTTVATDLLGYERGGDHVVRAYINSTHPLIPREVGRWQVYEVHRPAAAEEAEPEGLGGGPPPEAP